MAEENTNQSENNINYRILTSRSARQLRLPLNPLFNMIGANADEKEPIRTRTYADVVRDSLDLRFRNNVVPRGRVRDALYNILEEIENIREHLSEHSYLKLTNDLRTIYDYITQDDPVSDESFINHESGGVSAESQLATQANADSPPEESKQGQGQNQASITLMASFGSIDDRLSGLNNGMAVLLQSLLRSLVRLTSATDDEKLDPVELTVYQKYSEWLYSAIIWTVIKAPARQIWQVLVMTLWILFVLIFGLLHFIVASIERISSMSIKKIMIFGILILEEIIRHEQSVVQNIQLGILYVIIAECLSLCRQRIANIL